MAISVSVTQGVETQPTDLVAGTPVTYSIDNPLIGSSYFIFETTRNSEGIYDNTSPKNLEGSFTLGSGVSGLVNNEYIAGVTVAPGGGDVIFTPTNNVIAATLLLRGTKS